jgi:hypothetical protein
MKRDDVPTLLHVGSQARGALLYLLTVEEQTYAALSAPVHSALFHALGRLLRCPDDGALPMAARCAQHLLVDCGAQPVQKLLGRVVLDEVSHVAAFVQLTTGLLVAVHLWPESQNAALLEPIWSMLVVLASDPDGLAKLFRDDAVPFRKVSEAPRTDADGFCGLGVSVSFRELVAVFGYMGHLTLTQCDCVGGPHRSKRSRTSTRRA